jgi:hypothetical protein
MAKNDYSEDVALAVELIEEFGMEVKWNQQTVTEDTEKPWKESSGSNRANKVNMCFVANDNAQWRRLLYYLKGTEIPVGRLCGFMAGGQKFTPGLKDTVTRGKDILLIENIDVVQPAEVVVLYIVEFKG